MIIHRAPWRSRGPSGKLGEEFLPRSVRTGRPATHDRAEADYIDRYGHLRACPVADDPVDQPEQRAQIRIDQDAMAAWVDRHSARLSQRELDIYVSFWIEKRSHAGCAAFLDIDKDAVREAIKRIRRKAGIKIVRSV